MAEKTATPKGTQPLVPYLYVEDVAKALDFYAKALGATERVRLQMPGAKTVMHGEMDVGGNRFMLGEANQQQGHSTPKQLKGNHSGLVLYLPDVDASMERAAKAGCETTMKAEDMFWGDRMGAIKDPFGHSWMLATHQREVSAAEMQKAMEQMAKQHKG